MKVRTCQIDNCSKPHLARGYCGMHYKRWQIHGDPNTDGHYESGNVRWATYAEQSINKRIYKSSTTSARGVSKTSSGRYRARVYANKRTYLVGVFDTIAAAKARTEFVNKHKIGAV